MKVWHTINTKPNPEVEDKYKKACVSVDALNGTVQLTSGVDENGWVHVFELIAENRQEKHEIIEALKKGKLFLNGLGFQRFSMYKDESIFMEARRENFVCQKCGFETPDRKLAEQHYNTTDHFITLRDCVVCGRPTTYRTYTCGEGCHKTLVRQLVKQFGKFKKVVDVETGKTHKVPTADIIEKGLKYGDLKDYPVIK